MPYRCPLIFWGRSTTRPQASRLPTPRAASPTLLCTIWSRNEAADPYFPHLIRCLKPGSMPLLRTWIGTPGFIAKRCQRRIFSEVSGRNLLRKVMFLRNFTEKLVNKFVFLTNFMAKLVNKLVFFTRLLRLDADAKVNMRRRSRYGILRPFGGSEAHRTSSGRATRPSRDVHLT